MTALIWASGRGHTEVVDHLLEAGANPDAADKVRDVRECEDDARVITTRGSALWMNACMWTGWMYENLAQKCAFPLHKVQIFHCLAQ